MRHRVHGPRLNRQNSHRKATINSLVRHLILRNRIRTTLPKAEVASRLAERLITMGKSGDLSSQRYAFRFLQDRELVHRLFHVLAPLFKSRQGGYTRVIKLMPRRGDAAPLAMLEWVEIPPFEGVKKSPAVSEPEKSAKEGEKKAKQPVLKGLKRFLRHSA